MTRTTETLTGVGIVLLMMGISLMPAVLVTQHQTVLAAAQAAQKAPEIPSDLERVEVKGAGQWITIDGKTHPELIPEWAAWRCVFTWISGARRSEHPSTWQHYHDVLKLSAREEALLVDTAEKYRRSQEGAQKNADAYVAKQRAAGEPIKGEDMVLANRQAILDMADHLMEQLSPEGQASLVQFKTDRLDGYATTIPAGAWSNFRLPR